MVKKKVPNLLLLNLDLDSSNSWAMTTLSFTSNDFQSVSKQRLPNLLQASSMKCPYKYNNNDTRILHLLNDQLYETCLQFLD